MWNSLITITLMMLMISIGRTKKKKSTSVIGRKATKGGITLIPALFSAAAFT